MEVLIAVRRLFVALGVTFGAMCAILVGCGQAGPPPKTEQAFPVRPVDIATERIDPCSTLDSSQGRLLGLERREARAGTIDGRRSPTCLWLSETDLSYSVQTIPISAELARSERGAEIIEINGFGAVRSIPREFAGGTPICQVTVDAGPDQLVRVQAQATGERPRTDEEMCRIATDVTGMVMTTVVATARR